MTRSYPCPVPSGRLALARLGSCAALVCACICVCLSCKQEKSNSRGGGPPGGRPRPPPSVTARTLTTRPIADEIKVVIALTGREQSYVYSRVAGRVVAIERNEGQEVALRQVLFRVERTEPGESFLSVPVPSPIGGWMGRVLVMKGQQITPQDPLALVVDDAALRGIISLPQDVHQSVRMDTPVLIEAGTTRRQAKVVSIARAGDDDSGRGRFTVEVDNADHALQTGAVVMAGVRLNERPRLLVPTEALRITEQGAYVFAIENQKALRKAVTFELLSANDAEVTSGLSPGTQIVLKGASQLSDGATVRVVELDDKPMADEPSQPARPPEASATP